LLLSGEGERIEREQPTYRPGRREDFDRLYTATYQRIFGTVLALLRDRAAAEDCTQEAYLRAFRAWPAWKPTGPAEAWVHRIAINQVVSWRRRERLREVGELLRRLGAPEESETPDLALRSDLLRELRALPPRLAAALVLRHYHGYSNRDIGQALGIPERTVASRLIRARSRLQHRLADGHGWRTALTTGVATDE
jgi:RNA polymerase sigma-70 factor, ECF subfamily